MQIYADKCLLEIQEANYEKKKSPKFVRFKILTPEIMKTMKRDAMKYDG